MSTPPIPPAAQPSLRWRLTVGFLAIFAVTGLGVAGALLATRTVDDALERVVTLADQDRRLGRVGEGVREFYIHQAHLALGMAHGEHLALTRKARQMLQRGLDRLAERPGPVDVAALRATVARLDALLDDRFLPALAAGHGEHARHIHHEAAGDVQRVVDALEAYRVEVKQAIVEARAGADAAAARARAVSAGALGAALLLALGVGLWTTRAIVGPLDRLRAAATALPGAPEGTRVPADGPPEIASLGATLNQVLAALDEQRQARAEAETLAALGRVAGGIAHEINNPLGVILGHARFIEKAGGRGAEDGAVIAREARACKAIVQDLLDYARPGAGRAEACDLADLAGAAADRLEGCAVSGAGRPVRGDRRRLEQVLYNLMTNGLAFGQAVQVQVADDGEGVAVTVVDDGPGLDPADLEQVFQPFFTTRERGTGLGLAIARAVAQAHGGRLTAAPGPGGRFTLWLPAAEAA